MALPTYPFERRRFWFEAGLPRAAAPAPHRTEHPLLGARLSLPSSTEVRHECAVSNDDLSWLREHRVSGTAVFPASGFVETALAANPQLLESHEAALMQRLHDTMDAILSTAGGSSGSP